MQQLPPFFSEIDKGVTVAVDLVRIKAGLSRIEGKAADNQIIRDMTEMLFELEQQRRVVRALKDIIALVDPCIHQQMVEAQQAHAEGRTITLEEYMAQRGLADAG